MTPNPYDLQAVHSKEEKPVSAKDRFDDFADELWNRCKLFEPTGGLKKNDVAHVARQWFEAGNPSTRIAQLEQERDEKMVEIRRAQAIIDNMKPVWEAAIQLRPVDECPTTKNLVDGIVALRNRYAQLTNENERLKKERDGAVQRLEVEFGNVQTFASSLAEKIAKLDTAEDALRKITDRARGEVEDGASDRQMRDALQSIATCAAAALGEVNHD